MKCSVVIPLYNKANFVCETLQSLLDQSKLPYEIIIVDDCSTDGSIEKIESFIAYNRSHFDSIRLEIIKLKENSGPGYARNIGFNKTTGDLVSFLDADDLYKPQLIELVTQLAQHHQIGFLVVGIELFPSYKSYPTMEYIQPFISSITKDAYYLDQPLKAITSSGFVMGTGSNVFVKRTWVGQTKYHEGVRMNEANDFWYRILRDALKNEDGKIGLLTGNYIEVREVPESLSRRTYNNWREIDIPLVFTRYQNSKDIFDRLIMGLICSRWLPNAINSLPSINQKISFIINYRAVYWMSLKYKLSKLKKTYYANA